MANLLLRLSAPLQSWGSESKFETRRTEKFPTKSGVIGLIASALGYSREDSLEKLNALKFGVRIDHEGELIRDYHVAKTKDTSYVTNRYYLSDAVFLAGIETNDTAFLDEIETALKNPVFPLFLGKRSCPPTMPLFQGIRQTDLLTALRNEPLLYKQRSYLEMLRNRKSISSLTAIPLRKSFGMCQFLSAKQTGNLVSGTSGANMPKSPHSRILSRQHIIHSENRGEIICFYQEFPLTFPTGTPC